MGLGSATSVTIKVHWQDEYDRVRPQGGRSIGPIQSLGGEYRRDTREGNCQSGDVPQRRSSAGGALSFVEGAADGGREVVGVCGLSGNAADKTLLSRIPFLHLSSRSALPCFALFLATLLLAGCGSHKKTTVAVPPPPPIPSRSEPTTTTSPGKSSTTLGNDKNKDKEAHDESGEGPVAAKPVFEET